MSGSQPSPQRPTNQSGSGIAIGIAIGVALGVAMDNVGVGVGLGVAIGAALDSIPRMAARPKDKDPDQSDPKESSAD